MRQLLNFIFLLSLCHAGWSQTVFRGKVLSHSTGRPLEAVAIINTYGGEWALSDAQGKFRISIRSNKVNLEFRLLGKQTYSLTGKDIIDAGSIQVYMKDENLWLEEVTVTAVPKKDKVGSVITLDEYATSQVQSLSLSDMLQQLPGQTITPPRLNRSNSLSLRTAAPSTNNAAGVSFIMDGIVLSNDENMQAYGKAGKLTPYDNAGSGVDLRSIPAANIEQVEVISGIPDAQYGNLTSGVVNITRKAGVSPYSVNATLRQGNSLVSLQKGYKLGDRWGSLSLSMDYLNANQDPRKNLEKYNRITSSALWTVRKNDFRHTLSLTYRGNFDERNYSKEDDGGQEAKFKKDKGISIGSRSSLRLDHKWVDNLHLTLGFSYRSQHSYTQSFYNTGGKVVPKSLVTGLFPGGYTPAAYLQIREVYGKPIRGSLHLSFNKTLSTASTTHALRLGSNFSLSDNRGRGKGFDPAHAHATLTLTGASGSQDGLRSMDYGRQVKPQFNHGIYLQDNITHNLSGGRDLSVHLGFRFDMQNGHASYSPRVNLGYGLSDALRLRAGIGFATKTPPLVRLFPGNRYFDILIRDFRTRHYAYNLVQTYVQQINKLDLKPAKVWKYELGGNWNTPIANTTFTAFYNRTYDAFGKWDYKKRVPFPIVAFQFTDPERLPPTYSVEGYEPFILEYSLPVNGTKNTDKGIELFVAFKKVKAIHTSFNLKGSYVHTSSYHGTLFSKKNKNPLEKELVYGLYNSVPERREKIRLSLTMTHHISEIGLLASLTLEQHTRTISHATLRDRYPIAYLDSGLERHDIPEGEHSSPRYAPLFLSPSKAKTAVTPSYHNFHLRLTKELTNGLDMSFYAYNFLNYRPVIKVLGKEQVVNEKISFGATARYEF